MKASTIRWHLVRDNCEQLHKFCSTYGKIIKTTLNSTVVDEQPYFENVYWFDNGGSITVELLQGTEKQGFSIADHFQVVRYDAGYSDARNYQLLKDIPL